MFFKISPYQDFFLVASSDQILLLNDPNAILGQLGVENTRFHKLFCGYPAKLLVVPFNKSLSIKGNNLRFKPVISPLMPANFLDLKIPESETNPESSIRHQVTSQPLCYPDYLPIKPSINVSNFVHDHYRFLEKIALTFAKAAKKFLCCLVSDNGTSS
jgi:hypothetical protein